MSSTTISKVLDEMHGAQRRAVYVVDSYRVLCEELVQKNGHLTRGENDLGHALTGVLESLGAATKKTMMVVSLGRPNSELQDLRACWGRVHDLLKGDLNVPIIAQQFRGLCVAMEQQLNSMAVRCVQEHGAVNERQRRASFIQRSRN